MKISSDLQITSTVPVSSTTSPSLTTGTTKENDTFSTLDSGEHKDTSTFNFSSLLTTDHKTSSSTSSNDDLSSDIRYRTTTYSVEQTTTAQRISEGDNISVVCTGDVGKPPAAHVFQKYLNGHILPMQDTVTSTSISEMSENCSYYRSSNLTFAVTAKDNKAVIRCFVNSSMAEPDMFVETTPIGVYCE
ncbi:unnamed protein product [Mytilus coruscus]|uniref:CD80-like immunoglobulin C2-set domain-containing protein n=1 Tax=Mytilus coruscus TaxID=42192 RepID=A0A6J8BFK6_MYTCO|nr:unnamed protein product [Mytilus coruscus]